MTSELFVYVVLSGQTDFVTAGRFVLSTDGLGNPRGRFVYGRRYLERAEAVAIDPLELPLEERTFETLRMNGLFGALRDAGPDYWGLRRVSSGLTHRHFIAGAIPTIASNPHTHSASPAQ